MLLNMLNDLAEATKASDGKKIRNIVQQINAQELALHSTNAIHKIPKDAAKLGVEAVTRT